MALNPQPYLSDSTDEFLIDALPAIAAGLDPSDIIYAGIGTSVPESGDNMERVLGFLQLWLIERQVLMGHYVPMFQNMLQDTSEMESDEIESLRDQLTGARMLADMDPESDLFNILGSQLVEAARQAANDPEFREAYGSWFVDQRMEALDNLDRYFSGSPQQGITQVGTP
jgi:hypothetical protein